MKRFWGVAVTLAVLLSAGTASADAKAEREARTLFREANRLLAEKDYVAALDMFRAAYGRWPNPKILLNIGTTLRNLGRDAEAADAYDKYLREGKPDAKRTAEVAAILKELNARLATLRIAVTEPGARVLVDGKLVGDSPQTLALRVEPGTHTIVAEKQGFPASVATVQIGAGQERAIELRLVPPTGRTPPPVALAPVAATPAAPAVGPAATPAAATTPPVRTAQALGATAPAGEAVVVTAGQPARRRWNALRISSLVAGGVGVVTLVVGSVFGLQASAKNRDSRTYCRPDDPSLCLPQGVALRQDAMAAGNRSTVAFVVGGVAVAGGAALWILGGRRASGERAAPRVVAAPALGNGMWGLTVEGSL